ncbi:lysophospholipid acyltransferase family protein [Oceanobacter sp. 4_MG-2023]|uniref:lysophospholipid acyltransferase family protein n=1 Tax=Oceanobacter sp. 4_MG-2023 TaxID=3062623 RepID=UPI002735AACA|nr:lysophospholipid acyltransferase family protein [Oceanobacter sp. 4_MG-2023]MDP2547559.1 lysophospholipid acyltransferase family protein [Oceanobacter sp. 4_MG-2023]
MTTYLQRYLLRPLLWLLASVLVGLIRIMGRARIQKISRYAATGPIIARLTRLLLAKKNHYLDNNLQRLLPDASVAQRQHIRHCYYANMLLTATESLTMDGNERQRTQIEGLQHVQRAKDQGQGILWVSGHINNWEMNRRIIEQLGFPAWELYRDFADTRFDYLSFNRRFRVGPRMISTNRTGELIQHLKNGDNAHILIDIKVKKGRNGQQIDFAGQPAWTSTFAAEMALRHHMALIPTYTLRTNDGQYRQVFEPSLTPTQAVADDQLPAQARQITERINQSLANQLKQDPASWLLWDTNRWGP